MTATRLTSPTAIAKVRLLRGCGSFASNTLRALSRASSGSFSGDEGGSLIGWGGGGVTAGRGVGAGLGAGLLCAACAMNCSSSASRLLGNSGRVVGCSVVTGAEAGGDPDSAVDSSGLVCIESGSSDRPLRGLSGTWASVPIAEVEPCGPCAEFFCFCCSALRSASISKLTDGCSQSQVVGVVVRCNFFQKSPVAGDFACIPNSLPRCWHL